MNKTSLLAASLFVFSAMTAIAQNDLYHGPDLSPDGRGNRLRGMPPRGQAGGAVVTGNGISYHNGPVMKGTVNVYYIYYGNWASLNPTADAIFTDWAQHIGNSPYYNINTTYGDTIGNVSASVAYVSSINVPSSTYGTSLNDGNIYSIVADALNAGTLPTDANGVYFVLTARGIAETSGFLTQYCGWHTYGTIKNTIIKYSFVGDAGTSAGCSVQFGNSPNGNPSADAMISVIAHELEEAATDPQLNAWYDATGAENADKCAWNFGGTYVAPNGTTANMQLGTRHYLIQQNWVNANGGGCILAWNVAPDFSVAIAPTSRTVPYSGGSGAYTISTTPLNGFAGTVTYGAVGGVPANASATPVDGGGNFTVTTTAATPPGTYTLSVLATSAVPALSHTAATTLVVTAAPAASFSLSITPSSQIINRPGSTTYAVTISPVNGFSANVNLSITGLKTGVTSGFNPIAVAGGNGSSTLTITAGNSAKKGSSSFTVTATGSGVTKTVSGMVRVQ